MRTKALTLSLLCAGVANAQYNVEILHSPLVPATSSYGAGAGGGQQVGHTNLFLVGPSHALLWEGSAKSLVDLHPVGWDASYAMATDGRRQVGWRQDQVAQRATMWSGAAKGWVDLHDPTYNETNALGISGDVQVGFGFITNVGARAVMWRNTAASLVRLHPQGFDRSWAWATDGKHQVGFAQETNARHAALWTGSAKTYSDLHPSGYGISEALGVADGQQAGFATFMGNGHAIMWFGSNENYIDLNPGRDEEWGSVAYATNGVTQVGHARNILSHRHAASWQGGPRSYTNLHTLLPAVYQGSGAFSEATGIDQFGNIVGWATHLPTGANHAILWRPVPEPNPIFLLGLLSFIALLRRKAAHLGKSRVAGGNPASQGEGHHDSQTNLVDSRGNPRDPLLAGSFGPLLRSEDATFPENSCAIHLIHAKGGEFVMFGREEDGVLERLFNLRSKLG